MHAILILLALCQTPDGRGEVVLREPAYQGVRASAPIPAQLHVKNEGGSDGSGLCVIASVLANGQYQGVPGLGKPNERGEAGKGSTLWATAKSRRGGYWPERLEQLINEILPGEKWASYYGRDTAVLDKLSREGYPIGATMNTGRQYGYQRIAHMISLLHYRKGGTAAVLDNNFPGVYSWMPAAEFDRRWISGDGNGWAWIWTRKPGTLGPADGGALIVLVAGAAGAVLILLFGRS
jgi:hypothetical protein